MSADKDGGTTVWNEDGAGGDETELVPPVTEAGPAANAWSLDDVEAAVRSGFDTKFADKLTTLHAPRSRRH
jgi:hypothetical protein